MTDRIANFAATCPSAATGHVTVAECGICGSLDWISTSQAESRSHSVQPMEAGRCYVCGDAYHRNPEIFQWVLRVVEKAASQPDTSKGGA